jgi:uncharacterized protein
MKPELFHGGPSADIQYVCQRCTACCRWPGFVGLADPEVERIAEFLGLTPHEFAGRYTHLRPNRQGLALTEQADGACVFLDGDHCRIQPVKPQQCLDFPNRWRFPGWRETCRAIEVPCRRSPSPPE